MAGAKGKSGGKRRGAGRAEFKPTDEQRLTVEELAACGTTAETIARCIGIAEPTLRKHFADELERGREKVVALVAQGVIRKAISGDNASAFFYLKCWGGWRERQRVELTGSGGGPIQSTNLSPEEFREIARGIADEV